MAVIRKPEFDDENVQRLFDALHELHLRAGAPSVRAIQSRGVRYSRDTVHRVLAGPTIPVWQALEAVVRALDGDVERFRTLWIAAQHPAEEPVTEPEPVQPVDEPIRVLVVEDHPLYRSALARLLDQSGCTVVGAVSDGSSAIALAAETLPDVVVMDLKLPGMSGTEATAEICRTLPTVRVLVLTAHGERGEALNVISAGATGFLTKDADPDEIIAALRAVRAGRTYITKQLAAYQLAEASRAAQPVDLSPRERQILELVVQGMRDADIAEKMAMSVRTVRSHLDRIRDKTGLRRRTSLTRYAVEEGLVPAQQQDRL